MAVLKNYRNYCDVYFLRSKQILQKDNLNPWVKMQVFMRKAGIIAGIDESVALLRDNSHLFKNGGSVYALEENSKYGDNETVMVIEGHLQDIIEFETMYLGILSSQSTIASENTNQIINSRKIAENMKEIVELAGDRPVVYFGARHWHYSKDREIAAACLKAGAANTSTATGSLTIGREPAGTIPHALVLAYGDTVKATKAFDKHINKKIARVALVDTFNKEITDSLRCAREISSLAAVRLDTSGENYGEQCSHRTGKKYWYGKGVTVELAVKTRKALDKQGFNHVGIFLSSGFNKEKVRAFVDAEKKYDRLFDGIGTGSVFPEELRMATADIVAKDRTPFSKIGRAWKNNQKLQLVNS